MPSALSDLLAADEKFAAVSKQLGHAKAYAQFMSPHAIMLPNRNLPQVGIKSIVGFVSGAGAHSTLTWKPESGVVSQSGDVGYTWGNYRLIIRNDKKEAVETESGKYLNVWQKQKGVWKVIVDMGNLNPE